MTIEQKAKAYDEALKVLHKYDGAHIMFTQDLKEEMFPELKESDDERIRKALIDMVECAYKRGTIILREKEKEKCIAWLEKQGEHDSIEEPDFFDDFRNSDVEVDSNEDGLIADTVRYKNEMQDKQKSVDKAEPKFHEGEWISGYYTNYKVTAINKEGYSVEDTDGNKINILFENEKFHHLWTIQDAKDGDVLYFNDNTIVIFKDLYNATTFHSYCHIEDGVFDISEDNMPNWWEGKGFHPATEEQRNLLLEKMREAGYEWDREKKEVRKIDWNPQPGDTFRKKGTESPIYHLCDKLEDGIYFGVVEERENGIAGGKISIFTLKNEYELVERLKPIEKVIEEEFNKITELKPSWSEEDEKYLNIVSAVIGSPSVQDIYDYHKVNPTDVSGWLKEHIQPQSQWKPSEEQMKALNSVILKGELFYINQGKELISLYNDLKQL